MLTPELITEWRELSNEASRELAERSKDILRPSPALRRLQMNSPGMIPQLLDATEWALKQGYGKPEYQPPSLEDLKDY